MRSFSPSARILRVGFLCLLLLSPALVVAPVQAQGQGEAACDVPSFGGLVTTTLSNDTRMLRFTSPNLRCPGGLRITADSATVFESTNYSRFFGNVVFWDGDSRLTADNGQYFSEQRRLTASGNAVLTQTTEGSVIRGDQMTLIRAGPQQAEDILTVGGRRPHATLYPSPQPEPEVLVPDTINPEVLAVSPDSAAVLPDTLKIPPDSAAVPPDTLKIPPDSAAVLPDTLKIPPDSAAVLPDTLKPISPPIEAQDPSEVEVNRVPYEIDAQQFVLEGTRYFRASGAVEVTRDSLTALSDSLEYDQDQGALFLNQNARVTTGQTDLAADAIRLEIPQDEVRSAVATGNAILDGEDLRLLAPIIHIFFTEGRLEHLVAMRDVVSDSIDAEMDEEGRERQRLLRGAPPLAARELGLEEFPWRPYTLAQDFILEGDSLEVHAPGEVLEEVWAMGNARGESAGTDSLNAPDTPEVISRDWLEGDTIVAIFGVGGDSLSADEPLMDRGFDVEGVDTTEADYRLERLVARVGARSMYRMAASDSTVATQEGQFAIHYVIGDEITILLSETGEAERMEVIGQTRGIHLEPLGGQGQVVDTMVVPDTSVVNRGGQGPGPASSGVRPGGTGGTPGTGGRGVGR